MRVSVVVPVFNPGPYIRDLVDSLRDQTLDPAEFEVVFVDDGSTDATPALLDELAATAPNVRVIHTPNSGWPGRPRNLGIDAARGDYVFLADHDDRLDPAALERITAFADEHGSDVVVGRIIGVGRSAPAHVFARTVVDAQRDPALLMNSLTPQKLYRRAFLAEHGIRFPEGQRRLEDHLFVTTAYLRARRVSIYADHPIYYFVIRDDGQNASRRPIEWRGYFDNAAESVAVVDAEAPDEATRLVMRRRWLRVEAVGRLRGAAWLRRGEQRDALFGAVHDLLEQHYPIEEIDLLAPADRLAGRLALDGRRSDLQAVAEWEASSRVRPRLDGARIDLLADRLELRLTAERRATAALPAVLADPPAGYPRAAELTGVEGVPPGATAEVRLRHVGTSVVVRAEVEQRVEAGVLTATASVDLAGDPALRREGRWTVAVTFAGTGRVPADPLRVEGADAALVAGTEVRTAGRRFSLDVGDARRILLRVESAGPLARLRRIARATRERFTDQERRPPR